MSVEKQARWQCQNCLKARDAQIEATGSSNIAYQFNEANANAHLDANTTHVVQLVFCAVVV